jgi:hypothetical protein
MKLIVSGLPEPATDSMLAESFNLQDLIAILNGLLGSFFENARFNAVSVFKSGEANHLLLFHVRTPRDKKREASSE